MIRNHTIYQIFISVTTLHDGFQVGGQQLFSCIHNANVLLWRYNVPVFYPLSVSQTDRNGW